MALFASCFTASTVLAPRFAERNGRRPGRGDLLSVVLGDSRRLFANHFFLKADAYFHSGYYPSIFDVKDEGKVRGDVHLVSEQESDPHDAASKEEHQDPAHEPVKGKDKEQDHDHDHDHGHGQGESDGDRHDQEDELKFLGKASDWIDRFGRHFFPSEHSHLERATGQEEILPWLRLAAELDPNKVEVYTVAAFWLRTRLGKPDEAIQFLREGWLLNPDAHQILCELGKVFAENRNDPVRARNVLELAIVKWRKGEMGKAEPDVFGLGQIVTALVRLDESEGRWQEGVGHLELLKTISPNPDKIEILLKEFRGKVSGKGKDR